MRICGRRAGKTSQRLPKTIVSFREVSPSVASTVLIALVVLVVFLAAPLNGKGRRSLMGALFGLGDDLLGKAIFGNYILESLL